jgi:hypothetical protein
MTRRLHEAAPEQATTLPRRLLPDGQMHACIRNTAQGPYVMCIFIPPGL